MAGKDIPLSESSTKSTKRSMSSNCSLTENFGKMSLTLCLTQTISKNILVEHSPLEEVYIFFDTTTYDEIERDVKVMFAPYWSAGSYLLMF